MFDFEAVAGDEARVHRGVQVQQRHHGGVVGEVELNIEFGLDEQTETLCDGVIPPDTASIPNRCGGVGRGLSLSVCHALIGWREGVVGGVRYNRASKLLEVPALNKAAWCSIRLAGFMVVLLVALTRTKEVCAQNHVAVKPAAASVAKDVAPSGPAVVIDTSMGRMVCRLYEKEAPLTVANFIGLTEGSKDWKDPATDKIMHGTPFYDGTGLAGATDGVMGGDRLGMLRGTAGAPFVAEKSGLGFDRAGRLVMAKFTPEPGSPRGPVMTSSSVFLVLEHADKEYERRGGTCVWAVRRCFDRGGDRYLSCAVERG